MKFTLIKATYFLLFALTLIGQVHFSFPQNARADLPKKYFIEELLESYTQDKIDSSCISNQAIASVLKDDLTPPHRTLKPSIVSQNRSLEDPCSQVMKPIQKLLILPPFLSFEKNETNTDHNPINQRKAWEVLHSHFSKNKQLKIVSWERMHHLSETHSNSHNQNEKLLKLANLTDADAYLTTSIDTQKTKIQVYSTQDEHLLWEKESLHTSIHNLESLGQHLNMMAKDFLKSFPYHGIQILDPLWKEIILEKDFQNLAKVDVGSNSLIQEGDLVFWIEVCRTNKNPLFIDGGRAYTLAKGKVLKKERGILLTNITHHRAELNDWKQKIHEGTLVVSLDEGGNSFITNQDTSLHSTKNKADKTKSRLTISTGVLSILVLLAVLL